MPSIAQNGILAKGTYVVRYPDPKRSTVRKQCFLDWVAKHEPKVELVTKHWEKPSSTGFDFLDQERLAYAAKEKAYEGGWNEWSPDGGDEYQGIAVWEDGVPIWDYAGACPVVAWPWDGVGTLELQATGAPIKPYNELDAAKDAAEATVKKAGEVAAEIPAAANKALETAADVFPWWAKVGLGVAAAVGIGYAVRSVRGGR